MKLKLKLPPVSSLSPSIHVLFARQCSYSLPSTGPVMSFLVFLAILCSTSPCSVVLFTALSYPILPCLTLSDSALRSYSNPSFSYPIRFCTFLHLLFLSSSYVTLYHFYISTLQIWNGYTDRTGLERMGFLSSRWVSKWLYLRQGQFVSQSVSQSLSESISQSLCESIS